jgi:hypothetical protein
MCIRRWTFARLLFYGYKFSGGEKMQQTIISVDVGSGMVKGISGDG